VIAIIVILAGILFPVMANAREKARQTSCTSNMKQIGTAWALYLQDNDETFPLAYPGGTINSFRCVDMQYRGGFNGWIGNLLFPYAKNNAIFQCATNPEISAVNRGLNNVCMQGGPQAAMLNFGIQYVSVSYGYNYHALDRHRLSQIPRAADQIALADAISAWWDCPFMSDCGVWRTREIPAWLRKMSLPLATGMIDPYASGNWVGQFVQRAGPHHDQNNFLYADGHVAPRRWDKINWGNLNGTNIPEAHADYITPVTTRPVQNWPGLLN
jgi:prepilin-type processing-associated H-X9-DG protein